MRKEVFLGMQEVDGKGNKKMKSARWLMGLWAVICIVVVGTVSLAHGATVVVDGVTWIYTVDGSKATVTGATPASGTLTIPSKLGGYAVTGVGYDAFAKNKKITIVTIPDSVKNIGGGAFYNCTALQVVTIGNGVTNIEAEAFFKCTSLSSLAIGKGVVSMENCVFEECNKLSTVKLPDSLKAIGNHAFRHCYGLTTLTFGKNLKSIGNSAFEECDRLTSVKLPDSLETIGYGAFHLCDALVTLTIGQNVKTIEEYAFAECDSLPSVKIPASVTNIGAGAFCSCSSLKTLYVPAAWKGTPMVQNAADWSECTLVYYETTLTLGASSRSFTADAASEKILDVTANVSWTAKSSASWLTVKTASGSGNGTITYDVATNTGTSTRTATITVAGSGITRTFTVTQSGIEAKLELGGSGRNFSSDAANSKELSVTANVTWTTKSSASWLTVKTTSGSGNGTITYDVAANTGTDARTATLTVTGGGLTRTFVVTQNGAVNTRVETVDGIKWTYTVSGGAASVGGGDGTWIPAIPTSTAGAVSVPSTLGGYPVTGIGGGAFAECGGLTSVEIPDGVTSIGNNAFDCCYALEAVLLPESVTNIGYRAFGENALTSVTIPDSVKTIGAEAFSECLGLKSATFGNRVSLIGANAFYNCFRTEPKAVVLPASVTEVGEAAFYHTYSVSVYVPAAWEGSSLEGNLWVTPIHYDPSTLSPGANSRVFTAAAASGQELEVKGKVAWTAVAEVPWLTVKQGGGTGNGKIVYDVAANTGAVFRTGTIALNGGDAPWTFTVVQRGRTITLELAVSERSFGASATSGKELEVEARVAWTAKSNASWLTVKKGSGTGNGIIVYDIAANTGTASRTGTITVTGGGITRTFTVKQSGIEVQLELGSSERTFTAAAANSKELSVTATVSWTAKSSASWLTLKTASGSGNGKIVYNVAANTGTGLRTATITVTGGGITRTFTVKQSGTAATLVLGESERSFTAEAVNGRELGVTADVSWTAASSATWLTMETSSGTGNGTIVYDVAANIGTSARTATITVTGGGITRTFTATQSGSDPLLELAASSQSFTAAAATGEELEVTANVSWTAESGAAWLTVKTASGNGNGTITYDVAANPGTTERTGAITVTGGGLTRIFLATQSGQAARLELAETARTFTADAASGNGLVVSANVSWTATSSASWLAVRTPNGTGDGTVAYDVAENPGTDERMGAITVSGSGLTRIFLVTQGGKSETQKSPVGVPCQWLEDNASGILAATGGDYEAAAMALAANGLPVWKCYVAGLSTTDAEAQFKVKALSLADGKLKVEWIPDLNDNGTQTNRTYVIQGKQSMDDEWDVQTPSSRFFRVSVQMPAP